MKPPSMKGFGIDKADAWWVTCIQCGQMKLVFGVTADTEAEIFAREHLAEAHSPAVEGQETPVEGPLTAADYIRDHTGREDYQ